jgi:integral membrane protein (TIGR01906 family)
VAAQANLPDEFEIEGSKPGMKITASKTRIAFVSSLSFLITLAVPILLVMLSVRLVMTQSYLTLEYNKPDFPVDDFGFTQADRLHYAPYALDYLNLPVAIDYLGNLTFPDGRSLYNPRELQHMVDVKAVYSGALEVLVIAGLVFIASLIALLRFADGRQALRRGIFGGGLLMLGIIGFLVALLLIDWERFFDGFHDLFFAKGTWTFDYSDTLIRLFPVRFWQDAALTIGGLCVVSALLILVSCWWWARHESAQKRANVNGTLEGSRSP